VVSFPPVSPPRPYTPPSSHPHALHAQSISFFSILSPAQYWVSSTNHLAPRYAISFIPPLPRPSWVQIISSTPCSQNTLSFLSSHNTGTIHSQIKAYAVGWTSSMHGRYKKFIENYRGTTWREMPLLRHRLRWKDNTIREVDIRMRIGLISLRTQPDVCLQ
jgi:hypothetical protein